MHSDTIYTGYLVHRAKKCSKEFETIRDTIDHCRLLAHSGERYAFFLDLLADTEELEDRLEIFVRKVEREEENSA